MSDKLCSSCDTNYIFNNTDTLCRKCKKEKTGLEKRAESFKELKKQMISLIYTDDIDFETLTDKAQTLICETKVKLTNAEIVSFVNVYFNMGHKTHERLTTCDKFYQELDHANNMIVETYESTIGMYYQ